MILKMNGVAMPLVIEKGVKMILETELVKSIEEIAQMPFAVPFGIALVVIITGSFLENWLKKRKLESAAAFIHTGTRFTLAILSTEIVLEGFHFVVQTFDVLWN